MKVMKVDDNQNIMYTCQVNDNSRMIYVVKESDNYHYVLNCINCGYTGRYKWCSICDTAYNDMRSFDSIQEACEWMIDQKYEVFCFYNIREFAEWIIKQDA